MSEYDYWSPVILKMPANQPPSPYVNTTAMQATSCSMPPFAQAVSLPDADWVVVNMGPTFHKRVEYDFAAKKIYVRSAVGVSWGVDYSVQPGLTRPLKQPDPPPLPPVEERPRAGKRLIRWRPLKEQSDASG